MVAETLPKKKLLIGVDPGYQDSTAVVLEITDTTVVKQSARVIDHFQIHDLDLLPGSDFGISGVIEPEYTQPIKNLYFDPQPWDLESRPGKGTMPSDYVIVGLAPSPNRPKGRDNEPFGARSWAFLQSLIGEAPGSVYVTNMIKTPFPPGDNPPVKLIRQHVPSLMAEIQLIGPKRVLALGAQVAKALCPSFDSLREDHGTFFFNEQLNAFIIPTFHFSAVTRSPEYKKILARDLERFFEMPDPKKPSYKIVEVSKLGSDEFPLPKGSQVVVDIETTGFDPHVESILSIGLGVSQRGKPPSEIEPWIIPSPDKEDVELLRQLFTKKKNIVIGHNLQFDLYFLGVQTRHWDVHIEDTMLMSHNVGEEILALKHLTSFHTNRPGSRAFGGTQDFGYLAEDVMSTREVFDLFDTKTTGTFARELLNDLVPIVVGMRARGIYIDRTRCVEIYDQFYEESEQAKEGLNKRAGHEVNWNSGDQVSAYLLETGVPLKDKTSTGKYSVSEAVLVALSEKYEAAKLILDYRGMRKKCDFPVSYLKMTTEEHPYLHPRLHLHGTRTGRLSCSDPNLQQVPRIGPIKTVFVSRWEGGGIGLIDLSQAELRIVALIANDDKFAAMLMDGDAHENIAKMVVGDAAWNAMSRDEQKATRKKFKGLTFGLLYGGTAGGLAQKLGITKREVENILAKYFSVFPKLNKWIKRTQQIAVNTLQISTPFGRVRNLESLMIMEGAKSVYRKAVNTPIQGTASDVALVILRSVAQEVRSTGLKSRPMIGVHDSVLNEIYPGEDEAITAAVRHGFMALENTPLVEMPLYKTLPLVGEFIISTSWAHAESTNENYRPLSIHPCSSHGGGEGAEYFTYDEDI